MINDTKGINVMFGRCGVSTNKAHAADSSVVWAGDSLRTEQRDTPIEASFGPFAEVFRGSVSLHL